MLQSLISRATPATILAILFPAFPHYAQIRKILNTLANTFEIAQRIGPIKFALSFYRATLCFGVDQLRQYKGVITEALQSFIQAESD